jgi:hypothetical protein
MKTLKEIHSEANKYSKIEPLQDAFAAGARWALTGKYYKPSELFDNNTEVETADLEVEEEQKQMLVFEPTFEEWWNAYNKKRGRKKAEAKWKKLSLNDKVACMKATPLYIASTPDPVYRKDPLTYLNGECWNDEIIQKQDYEQQRNIQRSERAARLVASAYHQG